MAEPDGVRTVPTGPGIDLDTARRVLAAQPFSRMVGARVAAFGTGEAVLELPVRPDLLQQNGYVHGGVLAYLADNAITFAGGSALGPRVLTGGMSVTYLRPAAGTLLRAVAAVAYAGRRQAACRCDVFAVDGDREDLCAVAQGTVVGVPG